MKRNWVKRARVKYVLADLSVSAERNITYIHTHTHTGIRLEDDRQT